MRIFDSPLPPDAGASLSPAEEWARWAWSRRVASPSTPGASPSPFARLNDGTSNAIFVPLNVGDAGAPARRDDPARGVQVGQLRPAAAVASLPGGGAGPDGGDVRSPPPTQAILRNGKVYVAPTSSATDPTSTPTTGRGWWWSSTPPRRGRRGAHPAAARPHRVARTWSGWPACRPAAGTRCWSPAPGPGPTTTTSTSPRWTTRALVLLGANDQPTRGWVPSATRVLPPPSVGRAIPMGPGCTSPTRPPAGSTWWTGEQRLRGAGGLRRRRHAAAALRQLPHRPAARPVP